MIGSWRERFVPARDGTLLYVRDRISDDSVGLTAILCDGIACDGFIWRYLEEDLLDIANVVHWNYRGHGRSRAPVDASRVDISVFVEDLEVVRETVRETVSDAPLLLVGHSMGVQVVLESYRHRPEGIAGLVLICGCPGRMTHTFKGSNALAQALPRLIERVERNPRIARALWSNVPPSVAARVAIRMGEVDALIDPDDMVKYSEHVAGLDLYMFLRMLHACGESSAEDVLAEVKVPALVIAGDHDSFTPPHLSEDMAARIPDSELLMVPGATHVVPVERREEVKQRIGSFVASKVRCSIVAKDPT